MILREDVFFGFFFINYIGFDYCLRGFVEFYIRKICYVY